MDKTSVNKIAEVTLFFWIMKIIATTLGETAGDFISQTLNLGYIVGLAVTSAFLIIVLYSRSGRTGCIRPCSGPASWRPPPRARRCRT